MRKILLIVVVCLLLIFSGFFMINGISAVDIHGFMDLHEENKKIDQKIEELANDSIITYEKSKTKIKSAANDLTKSKTEYENQAILSSSQTSNYVTQTEKYDIEYLWTRLGNYAKDEGCTLKIDVSSTDEEKENNLYNLRFHVGGSYAGITDFIYDIENDSKLGFQIENFAITSPGNTLTATFDCTGIPISVFQTEDENKEEAKEGEEENTQGNAEETTEEDEKTIGDYLEDPEGNS